MKLIFGILYVISICMNDNLAIITRIDHSIPITRNFQRDSRTPLFSNWETGLREAIYQTLFRDRIAFPHLREYLELAPIIGRQDIATPFGDVAIIARGQMYSAPGGFQLVQDPYQNDCDGCHNTPVQCDHISCKNWKPEGHERLLALWTVKRIRHRDSNYGYRYELEYKVTSMNIAANEHFITRNGKFDYSVPGHIFIVKADPQLATNFQRTRGVSDKRSPQSYYQAEEEHYQTFKPHYLPPPPIPSVDEYYDNDPRTSGYPDVLYGPPELYTKRPPSNKFTTKKPLYSYDLTQNDSFDNLFDVFSSTTTTKMPDWNLLPTTQQSLPIFTPAISTTLKPTMPTMFNHPRESMQPDMFYQIPTKQMPILPTPDRTTRILKDNPPIKDNKFIQTTSSLSSTSTTHNIQEMTSTEKTTDFKYSEVDPLYTTKYSTHSTQPTYPATVKSTRPFTQIATTETDDYDIFGDITNNQKSPNNANNNINFPHNMNIQLTPGEQAITIVKPPKLSNQNNKAYTTTQSNKETINSTLQKLNSTVRVKDISEPNISTITPAYKEKLSTIKNNYEVTEPTKETTSTAEAEVEIFTQTTIPVTAKLFNTATTINCSMYTTEKPHKYTINAIPTSKASPPTMKDMAYTTMMLTPDQYKVTPPMEDTTYISTLLTTTRMTTEAIKEPTSDYTTEITTPYAIDTTAANKTSIKSTRPLFVTPLSMLTTTTTRIPSTVRPSSPQTTIRKTTKKVPVPTTSFTKNIYEDDYDIFGTSQDIETKSPTTTTKKFNSEEIDEIFGETKKDKPKYNGSITAETTTLSSTTLKIIYSNFYSPSTDSTVSPTSTAEFTKDEQEVTTETTTVHMFNDSNENITDTTTTSEPITKQSYSTSVSFEINKIDEHTSANNMSQLVDKDSENNTYLKNVNSKEKNYNHLTDCNSTIAYNKDNNNILNDLTLSVVNHAKSIDILNSNKELDPQESITSKNNQANNNNRKKRKYKRKRMHKIQNVNISK